MIHPTETGTNIPTGPVKDFKHPHTPSQESETGLPGERISISEKTKLFEGDTSLTESLREEFGQIFQLGSGRTGPFLARLDRIAEEAGI